MNPSEPLSYTFALWPQGQNYTDTDQVTEGGVVVTPRLSFPQVTHARELHAETKIDVIESLNQAEMLMPVGNWTVFAFIEVLVPLVSLPPLPLIRQLDL